MKFISTISKITRTAAIIAIATGAICSCDKPFEIEQPLGVTSKTVNLKASAGETPVIVYASGDWTAHLTDPVDWASIDRLHGSGMSQIKFAYSQNFGAARKVGIIFESSKEIPDTVMMIQAAGIQKPNFQFAKSEVSASKLQTTLQLGFRTELVYNIDEITDEITYDQENETGWISDLTISSDLVTCRLAENTSGAERSATVTLTHKDAKDNVQKTFMKLVQSADIPEMEADLSQVGPGIESAEQTISIPIASNLSALYDQLIFETSYEGSQSGWISNIRIENNQLVFNVSTNPEKALREATIHCHYQGEDGQTYSFDVPIMQKRYILVYTFEELKALIPEPEGEVIISVIQGNEGNLNAIVIGDKDNENMEINEPKVDGQNKRGFDWSGNPTTNYIQNEDGTSGIRLKCSTIPDNVFERYSKVTLNLEGMRLVKEAEPTRYTLYDVKAANVISNEAGNSDNVPFKTKTISQLTDDDIYTSTTIKNVEMTFKKGGYTNLHDGYTWKSNDDKSRPGNATPFIDAAPASIRDAEGQSMYMIFNMKTPWRKSGKGVFQGTANISGIVVNTKLIRYAKDGDLGRYSLRVLEEGDIAGSGNRFSKTLVEWDWAGQTTNLLNPTTGEGKLSFSMIDGSTLKTHNDFNSKDYTSGEANGCLVVERPYWWDDEKDEAPYFLVEFSTSGISGSNLVFNWAIGQGNSGGASITAPAYWHIEYSTDGVHFTKLEKDYAIRPLVWWSNTLSLSAIPGFHNYTTPLPASLFGQEKVTLKIIASSKLAATTDENVEAPTSSKPNNWIRMDQMAIEYN